MILVRPFTEADDVAGFHAARGILTCEGGKASHAALVARGMGRPAWCGAAALEIDLAGGDGPRRRDTSSASGDRIAIDGTTGCVTLDDVPLVEPECSEQLRARCSPGRTRSAASACAPTPTRPRTRARRASYGAEGIGLCRTEHMFMAERPPAEDAGDDHGRRRGARRARAGRAAAAAAGGLRGPVRGDGRASRSRSACSTRRCTSSSRTCPSCGRERRARARSSDADDLEELERTLERVQELARGRTRCSARAAAGSGSCIPEIYEMQVEAIMRAARRCASATGERAAAWRS